MKPAENIKKFIKNRKPNISASNDFDKRVLSDSFTAMEETMRTTSAVNQPKIWRIIMKNKITKFAIATIIVVVAIFGINQFGGSVDGTTPAYAIEQTIQASHSVQYLHIKSFMTSISDEPIECWVEFDPYGQIMNIRLNKPAWMTPTDGETVIIWKDSKATFWIPKKNFLITDKDQEIAAQILSMVEQLDPKNAVANTLQAQKQGDITVAIEEPENKAEPIIITVTSLVENSLPFPRVILFVDQATKLLNSVEAYQLKDGGYVHFSTVEFYDYNIPIDSAIFTFDNLPDDVLRMDRTTQEVGLVQGNLTDKEIAVEVIRQFLEALIEKDYAKAGRMWGSVPVERMQKTYGPIKFIRIISINEPVSRPEMKALYVPCTVEIEENGIISQWSPEHSYVRRVYGQPERWKIIGGFRGI